MPHGNHENPTPHIAPRESGCPQPGGGHDEGRMADRATVAAQRLAAPDWTTCFGWPGLLAHHDRP